MRWVVVTLLTQYPCRCDGWGVHSDPLSVSIHVSIDDGAATAGGQNETLRVVEAMQPDVISGAWRNGDLTARSQGLATAVAAQSDYSRSVGFSAESAKRLALPNAVGPEGRSVAANGATAMDPLASAWHDLVTKQGMVRVAGIAEYVLAHGVGASLSRRPTGWSDEHNALFVRAVRKDKQLNCTLPPDFHIRQHVADVRRRVCNSSESCAHLLRDPIIHEYQRWSFRANVAAWTDAVKTTVAAANEAPFNGPARQPGVSGGGVPGSCWRDRTQVAAGQQGGGLVGWSAWDLALSRAGYEILAEI